MNSKTTCLIIKIIITLSLGVIMIVAYKFYHATEINRDLVKKYSADYFSVSDQEVVIDELSDDQLAASSGAANKQQRRKKTTTSTVSSTIKPTIATTTTTVSTSSVTTNTAVMATQKVVTGIAAGYILSTMTESQIRNYLGEMNKLGLTWVRFDMDWSGIQSNGPSTYNWTEIDKIVRLAKEYNINVLAILGYAPRWAANDNCVLGQLCAPKSPELFGIFAAEAAKRYKDSISTWEIWNEPNMDYFWSPKADGTEYTKVLKAGYAAIKSVQPDSVVLTGGLSPVTSSGTTVNPLVFIEDIYAAAGKGYFDAVGHHPYTYALSPSSILPWNHWYQMYKIYDIMNLNGDAAKKIWITEIGAPTGGAGSGRELGVLNFVYGRDYLTQTAQAETMTALINESAKISQWIGPVFWYSLIDINSNSVDPEGHFGLITSNNLYKPAYDALLSNLKKQ